VRGGPVLLPDSGRAARVRARRCRRRHRARAAPGRCEACAAHRVTAARSAMVEVPVKKYRTKRAFKWLKRRLLPLRVRARKVERRWRRRDRAGWPPPGADPAQGLEAYEYSLQSQNGEDGILRFLVAEIGFGTRRFVEFGFGAHQ